MAGAAALVASLAGDAASGDWKLDPSLSVRAIYDDNLFSTPAGREHDLVTRVGASLAPQWRGSRLTFTGHYAVDAEAFSRHPELDAMVARQDAAASLRGRPGRLLDLAANVTFLQTQSPNELNTATGLALGRARATRLTFGPQATWRAARGTTAEFEYEFVRDTLAGGFWDETHLARAVFTWRVAARTSTGVTYEAHRHGFSQRSPELSHALLLRWSRVLGRSTQLELQAGPRLSTGGLDGAADLSIRRRTSGTELAIAATRAQTTTFGHVGVISTDSASLAFRREGLRGPQFGVTTAALHNRVDGLHVWVYQLRVDLSIRLVSWLSLSGAHELSVQRGGLTGEIARNVASLGLVLKPRPPRGGTRS